MAFPSLPIGYRFHPTDEELICHYLKFKMLGVNSEVDHVIAEVDICKWEPWELPAKSIIPSDDSEWFFLCPRKSKSSNNNRAERSTKSGHWKITGPDRKIKGQTIRGDIGKKKTLTFYEGRASEKRKTNWVIHEYHPEPDVPQPNQKAYVICRLKRKTDENADTPNRDEGEPSANIPSHFEMQTDNVGIPSYPIEHVEFYTNEPRQMNLDSILNSFQHSPIYSDQEIDILPPNVYDNEFMAVLAGDETEEDPTEFVNGFLNDDPYGNFNGVTRHNIFNDRCMPTSSKRAYFQDSPSSSDTDTEAANGQYIQTLGSSSSFGEPVGSKKIRHMQVVGTPDQTVRTSMGKVVAKRVNLPEKKKEKEMSSAESNNERKIVKGSNVEKHSKLERLESSSIQGKSLFVYVDTSSVSSLKSRPQAEYIFNALVGMLLFLVFARELVLHGTWC